MKRKWVSGFLGMIIIGAVVTGCGGQEKENADHDNAKVEDTVKTREDSKEKITIGFVQSGEASDRKTAVTASMNDTFREANGYTLKLEDAGEEQERQFTAVRKLVKERVAYLVISTFMDESTLYLGEDERKKIQEEWEMVLTEAKDAGIPVILAGNELELSDDDLYAAWVGSDYLQQGYDAAGFLEEFMKTAGRDSEEIRVAWVADAKNDTAWVTRLAGFREWQDMQKLENWKLFSSEGKLKQEVAYGGNGEQWIISESALEKMIKKNKKIDVLICDTDAMALKAIEQLEAAGKTCGLDGDVTVISFGAGKAGLEAVLDGKINAAVECSTQYGTYVEDVVKRLMAGDEVDKRQYLAEDIFTSENAGDAVEKIQY